MSTTKKGFALRTFKDAGTEKEFEGGKTHDFEPGEFVNFEAAGLICAPDKAPKAEQAAKTEAAKS
ncbi:hypothetical protein HZY97_20185 [Sphingomonas sp. R-74633]|uniref:hypothetical protein n=1 Tax=Sphingomonas sp. R-74633 TaxID=2751188 RepID=UPI0015D1659F|nr:hypothetical protein [Sphingomonas sp. R-74633]NYT43105.1 hypothetical protein [Sphingomonas sp. R-74633]